MAIEVNAMALDPNALLAAARSVTSQLVRPRHRVALALRGLDDEDVTQEVLLAVLRKERTSEGYDPQRCDLRGYVFVVGRSTLAQLLERMAQPTPMAADDVTLPTLPVRGTGSELESCADRYWAGDRSEVDLPWGRGHHRPPSVRTQRRHAAAAARRSRVEGDAV